MAMQTQQVLSVLRCAVRELSSPRPGTPTAAVAAEGDSGAARSQQQHNAAPSNAHILLQISALHKAFLSLSEAFMEELNGRQAEQEQQQQALHSVRRECAGKLQIAAALQADVQQLAAAHGQQAHGQAVLAQRCGQLEQEVARLRQQLGDQEAELDQRVEAAVSRHLAAAQRQWQEQALPAAAQQAVQRWAAEALPPLVQPIQEAVAAAAELAAAVAADVAGLAGEMERLAAAQQNHEQRLGHLENGGMQDTAVAAAEAGANAAANMAQLQQQVSSLQQSHAELAGSLQRLQQQQSAAVAAAATGAARDSQQLQWQQQWQQAQQGEEERESSEVQRQLLSAVAEQQAQQARTTEQLVSSVAMDVMALARHTKALDREMRALRKEVQQTQQALLQSCSVFSRALSVPSPVGPFTSLPPQL